MTSSKGFFSIGLGIIVFIALIVGGYYFYQSQFNNNQAEVEIFATPTTAQISSPTSAPTPTLGQVNPQPRTKEHSAVLNGYEYGKGHYPAYEVTIDIPTSSTVASEENNMRIVISNADFRMNIGAFYEAYKLPLQQKLDKQLINSNFETGIYRVFYNNQHIYTDKYEESGNGGCTGMEPQPVACLMDTAGPFNINCEPKTEEGLNECDRILSTMVYRFVQ